MLHVLGGALTSPKREFPRLWKVSPIISTFVISSWTASSALWSLASCMPGGRVQSAECRVQSAGVTSQERAVRAMSVEQVHSNVAYSVNAACVASYH